MGHLQIGTTLRYIHHRDRGDEAKLLAEAFALSGPEAIDRAARSKS
jgi:hypothetical protein